jgi:hypothetical protein
MTYGRKTGGRKAGTPNKIPATTDKGATYLTGLMPLEYMLIVLRADESTKEDRRWAALAAAPYVHAKLVATEMKVSGSLITEIQNRIIDHGSNT